MSTPVIRTLIVDDSAFVRKAVREMLSRSPQIEVVGYARNGQDALEAVETFKPDVVTCDLIMPEMDGVGFVRAQMARRPLPIVILAASSLDGPKVLEALQAGAMDFVQKPTALASEQIHAIQEELIEKVKAASQAPKHALRPLKIVEAPLSRTTRRIATKVDVVVLGISTGGPQALRYLVPQFPADFPVPLVIVLHMPVGYTAMFAENLAGTAQLTVREASQGHKIRPGDAIIARAGRHLTFQRDAKGEVTLHLSTTPMDKPHCPSVDVLFQSAAEVFGRRALGVVMTGMGDDGKQGSAWIKAQGGTILTEAEESCVIYGMPRSVAESGLSDGTVPLAKMADEIIKRL